MKILDFKLVRYCPALLWIFLSIPFANTFAQTPFMTAAEVSMNALTPAQLHQYEKITQLPYVKSLTFVELANLENMQQDGFLEIAIPGKDCVTKLKAERVESYENGDFRWYANVTGGVVSANEDCICFDGYAFLRKINGRLSGNIMVDDDQYELNSLGQGKNVLITLKEENLEGCANKSTPSSSNDKEESVPYAQVRVDNNCPIRVLALFTPQAEQDSPEPVEDRIRAAVEDTKQIMRNSNLETVASFLNLVDVQEFDFEETGDIDADRDLLIEETVNIRNANDADIVLVYAGNAYSSLGVSGTLNLQAERALCLIEITSATSNHTTAHEMGHIFACQHEPCDAGQATTACVDDEQEGHAHSFIRKWLRRRRTVVFGLPNPRTIPHYSNPAVEWNGRATGIEDERNNAIIISNNACTVAGFRNDALEAPLMTNVKGPTYACPGAGAAFAVEASGGGTGNYQYEWRVSTDGFNYGGVVSTNSSISTTAPIEGNTRYVKVKVTAPNGQTVNDFDEVTAAIEWPGQAGSCHRSAAEVEAILNANRILTYPNPTLESITIQFPTLDNHEVHLQVVDVTGKLVKTLKLATPIFQNKIELSLKNLPDGSYWIKLGDFEMQKVVKLSER